MSATSLCSESFIFSSIQNLKQLKYIKLLHHLMVCMGVKLGFSSYGKKSLHEYRVPMRIFGPDREEVTRLEGCIMRSPMNCTLTKY